MKNLIIAIPIVLTFLGILNQQRTGTAHAIKSEQRLLAVQHKPYKPFSEFNLDTLKYVQTNFWLRSGAYVNKSFDVLLSDLEIPIVGFVVGRSGSNSKLSGQINLRFFNEDQISSKIAHHKNPVILIVEWKNPLPSEEVFLLARNHRNAWNKGVQQFFSSKIIASVKMAKYDFKAP